jgi:hypothetical protein
MKIGLYTWAILRDQASGWVVVSRHFTFDTGQRALAGMLKNHDGLVLKPIELTGMGRPIFEPRIGESVRLVGQFIHPQETR